MNRLAEITLDKCSGDITFAKKILRNSASLAHEEGDMESFEYETEAFQVLEIMDSKVKR